MKTTNSFVSAQTTKNCSMSEGFVSWFGMTGLNFCFWCWIYIFVTEDIRMYWWLAFVHPRLHDVVYGNWTSFQVNALDRWLELVAFLLKRTPRRVQLSLSEAIQLERHDLNTIQTKTLVSDLKSRHVREEKSANLFCNNFQFRFLTKTINFIVSTFVGTCKLTINCWTTNTTKNLWTKITPAS